MEELFAFIVALLARNAGRRVGGRRRGAATPQAPAVNRLVETLKDGHARTGLPTALPAPQRPAPRAAIAALPEPPVLERFAANDMTFIDEALVRPRRRDPIGTLAALRSSRGVLGAIVASEILAPPLALRSERREA